MLYALSSNGLLSIPFNKLPCFTQKVGELGLTKEQLHDGFGNHNGDFVSGMDEVIRKLYETDHDLIIISDSHRVNIEDFLKKNLVFDLFEEIFCKPANITEEGKIL